MRQPLYLRLRPFLRRDLRARLATALVTVFLLTGLSWLGVSALSKIDSREAHQLRVDVGLEHAWSVCGGPDQPQCSYEDRQQARVDRAFSHERRVRVSVLRELTARTELALGQLDKATALAEAARTHPRTGGLQGDTVGLRVALLHSVVDVRPAPVASVEARRARLLWPLEYAPEDCDGRDLAFDGIGWVGCGQVGDAVGGGTPDMRLRLLRQIALEKTTILELQNRVHRLLQRDIEADPDTTGLADRMDLVTDLTPSGEELPRDFAERMTLAAWLAVRPPSAAIEGWALFDGYSDLDMMSSSVLHGVSASGMPDIDADLAGVARNHIEDLHEALSNPAAAVWQGAWTDPNAESATIMKSTERYRSPIRAEQRWQLLGTALLLLSTIMLVVIGPVVTATTTAREREAGTLPVLRMTGLSASDLALAMTLGPNVFALVAGGGLLLLSISLLAATAGLAAIMVPLALVLAFSAATHLTAIGLGDALGQRVNALVVGALLALGVLVPGLIGTVMVVGDMAGTGFLLGPLPATLGTIVGLSGLPFAEHVASGGSSQLGMTILGYGLVCQLILGALCLLSWRRRVEQAWTPLFRPFEGALLAVASVGCSALVVLDLSERINVQTYDHVNLITFVATGFLMPILGWLLVSSLVRPARASAVASVTEVRRGFWRFQAFVMLTAAALAGAYSMVLDRTGLGSEESEIMWATITQGLLIAETAVATLLWASRKRTNRHRVIIFGALVVVLQIVFTVGMYNLEVEHVALTQMAGNPFMLGMDASPYWLAFLVVLWAAGLGLILAALLRERDRAGNEHQAEFGDELDDDEDPEGKHSRWLH